MRMETYLFPQDGSGWEDATVSEGSASDVSVGPHPISLLQGSGRDPDPELRHYRTSQILPTATTEQPTGSVMDHAWGAIRTATSKTAQKTYLNIVLVIIGNVVLIALALIAYVLFYNNYVPEQVTTVPVHLQYGYGVHPYGMASLADANVKTGQAYDLTVRLSLPLSPPNTERGNFMVALHLVDAPSTPSRTRPASGPLAHAPQPPFSPLDLRAQLADRAVLFSSTRPAILPYRDPLLAVASRLLLLPVHVVLPRLARADLDVSLAESLEVLARGAGAPPDVLVEIQAGQDIHVYSVDVTLKARLAGLRWFMYEHYVLAGTLLSTGFWLCEVVAAALAWIITSAALGAKVAPKAAGETTGRQRGLVKDEPADDYMSDTERTFPSTSKQPPIKYESRNTSVADWPAAEVPPAAPAGAEADDEDDGYVEDAAAAGFDGTWRDSGIGTGLSDMTDASRVRRRTSIKSVHSSR